MAFTFGGAAGDDVNTSLNLSPFNSFRPGLLMGWWYPTTLTAGRVYFGGATESRLEVGATTSELSVVLDRVTDGVWASSGAGIAVDNWYFIAWYWAGGSSSAEIRVWLGTETTRPTLLSMTNTTPPSGGPTGNASIALGNKGSTGSLAFQGDIESVLFVNTDSSASVGTDPFGHFSSTSIISDTEINVYDRWVKPMWSGWLPTAQDLKLGVLAYREIYWFPLIGDGALAYRTSTVATLTDTFTAPTYNGVTVSQRRGPRAYGNPVHCYEVRR